MDGQVRFITRVLKEHDRSLFAKRNADGIICVMRKNKRYVGPVDLNDAPFFNLIESPDYVFALTENWTTSGRPVPWGSEVVVRRIKEIDLWNREKYFEEVEEANERVDKAKRRHFRNEMEAFASDWRREFAKATNDINTSTMDKSEKRRRKRDGNRERNERYK